MSVPGLRGVEHIGLTVPDLEEAVRFFVEVLGCERVYDMGPVVDEGTWMRDNLNVRSRAEIRNFVLLRCANGANFEIFEYSAPDQNQDWPQMSDWGGQHIAFYVDDMDAALAHLTDNGVRVLGGKKAGIRAEAGEGAYFAHFLTPWGQLCEFVTYPHGRAYAEDTDRRLWQPDAT